MATIIGTGRNQLNQSLAISDRLANAEIKRNQAEQQINDAQDQQQAQSIGSLAGMAAEQGVKKAFGSKQAPVAIGEAVPVVNNTAAGLAEQGAMEGTTNAMNTNVQQGLQAAIDKQMGEQAIGAGMDAAAEQGVEMAANSAAEAIATETATAAATDAAATATAEAVALEAGAAATGELAAAAGPAAGMGPVGWAGLGLLALSQVV